MSRQTKFKISVLDADSNLIASDSVSAYDLVDAADFLVKHMAGTHEGFIDTKVLDALRVKDDSHTLMISPE